MNAISTVGQSTIVAPNIDSFQFPANGQALLQFIGAIDAADSTEEISLVLHDEHAPIQLTRRQIQVALLESDTLNELHARIEEAANQIANGVDVNTTAGSKLIRTLAKNVRSAKSMVTNIADATKKQVDAAIELPTATKKNIIANVKGFTDSVESTWLNVRAPLTAIEELEKKRKTDIEKIMAELDEMTVAFDKVNNDFYPSQVFADRIERLATIIPESLKDEPKLIAKAQDVAKELPDYLASAKLYEKQKLDLAEANDARLKAEVKAEVQGDLLKNAVHIGADIGKEHQIQANLQQAEAIAEKAEQVPAVVEKAPAPAQAITLEQKQIMATAWEKVRIQNGITSPEGKAAFELTVRLLIKGMFPYASVTWSE